MRKTIGSCAVLLLSSISACTEKSEHTELSGKVFEAPAQEITNSAEEHSSSVYIFKFSVDSTPHICVYEETAEGDLVAREKFALDLRIAQNFRADAQKTYQNLAVLNALVGGSKLVLGWTLEVVGTGLSVSNPAVAQLIGFTIAARGYQQRVKGQEMFSRTAPDLLQKARASGFFVDIENKKSFRFSEASFGEFIHLSGEDANLILSLYSDGTESSSGQMGRLSEEARNESILCESERIERTGAI